MNKQDLTLLKEQYIEMRLRDRPYQSLLEKTEPIIPQWLLDEDTNCGNFVLGGDMKKQIRQSRYRSKWMALVGAKSDGLGRFIVEHEGTWFLFSPQKNSLCTPVRNNATAVRIQPALHLILKERGLI